MAKGKSRSKTGGKAIMTPKAAARIQSSEAKSNRGKVVKAGFATRAMAAAAKNK